jgi:mannose-6-phosphate isomerase-like protein (cupin superfamily)
MLHTHAPANVAKGWSLGPWNASLPVAVGYANAGVDEPHRHRRITEIYLVASGTAEIRVEARTLVLAAHDVLVVAPGEAHTFLGSSPEYFHFVLHVPALPPAEAAADKVPVSRADLGL